MIRNVFVCGLLFLTVNLFSQFSISGKVFDANGKAMVGTNVLIQELQSGVTSSDDGSFNIKNLKEGTYTLQATYLGYQNFSKSIDLKENEVLNITLKESAILAEEVLVTATRAADESPIAHTQVTKEELNSRNLGQDLPYLLSLTPSMVVSSDAGAGIGYTSFRIRGTDASRINTTVNGIPMNDAESHGVWWVNMPDFVSSLENVQVQRGVGASTNGAGAFGATINMQTNTLQDKAYAEVSSSAGTFNTFKNTVKVGTGLLGDHFAFDMRLSKINSDGFIDRAKSDLKSFFLSGGYYAKNTIVKVNIFSGKEKTYQAWNGVPKVRLENDLEGMQRYADHWLYSQDEVDLMVSSDPRTYNFYTYENETDNYQQDHYQLFFSQKIGAYFNLNIAGHYTYGRGYYEQYKEGEDFKDYNLPNVITTSDTITSTDLVRQKWLDNDFYGTTFSLGFKNNGLDITLGGAWNQYDGRHFGEIKWAQFLGDTPKDYEWYRSTGVKTDFNIYAKASYVIIPQVAVFGDIQYRNIIHDIVGIDDDLRDITQKHEFDFLNPKFGVLVKPSKNQEVFASIAVGHREPTRSNFTDADTSKPTPKEERMVDIELGYTYTNNKLKVGANVYSMTYKDQLIVTGEINEVGSPIMVNVDKSYRRGIEIFGGVQIVDNLLRWDGNATISENKILEFTEYVDNWDTWEQESEVLKNTDIAFAPNLLATSQIKISPIKNFNIGLVSQYVSEQFIDNTSSDDRKLDAYFINNLKFDYTIQFKGVKSLEFNLLVNNIFSEEYETNAWVYSYLLGGERYAMDGYFPQAGINFMAGVNLRF